MEDKKPIDHDDYKIDGIPGALNFTKWIRENDPPAPHQYKVGDLVITICVEEITELRKDCDTSPLYCFGMSKNNPEHIILRLADNSEDGLTASELLKILKKEDN